MKRSFAEDTVVRGPGSNPPASAAVVVWFVDAELKADPKAIGLGTGSITFSAPHSNCLASHLEGMQTSETARILSVGAPVRPQSISVPHPAERAGGSGPGELAHFEGCPTLAALPSSVANSLIAFGSRIADRLQDRTAPLVRSGMSGFVNESAAEIGAIAAVREPATSPLSSSVSPAPTRLRESEAPRFRARHERYFRAG